MTSIFTQEGKNIPCTVIKAEPNVVTQIKTIENDGYNAIQVAAIEKREKSTNKPQKGLFNKVGTTPKQKLIEMKNIGAEYKTGDSISINDFNIGEFVDVQGVSKGKGFQGVVKRHGFAGVGGQTHGQHNRNRAPGSIGNASTPSRVFKGMKMAGRTGGVNRKQLNLEIVKIVPEDNLLVIKGAVPGHKGGIVIVEK
ncbi:MAG: 50S ribosomal protein L3 [Bacteroidetes bacterium TMED39]|nr:MAG: 50S ribosomal protein L3 [Bacteroidetes bacterium TMED39]|tara:strand:- start:2203 stop:2790 length:588 start_codon:yes stop_codon:yes gene_type:complete